MNRQAARTELLALKNAISESGMKFSPEKSDSLNSSLLILNNKSKPNTK